MIAVTRAAVPDDSRETWLSGDLEGDVNLHSTTVDAIISAGPLDRFAAWLARSALTGISHIVALSSMSAESKVTSPELSERTIAWRLREAEATLAASCAARGCRWTVLRPTLVWGAGMDQSLTPLVWHARRTRLFPLVPGARGLRQPVHADDLAAACVASLEKSASTHGKIFALGGGERLSYAEMLRRVRASVGVATLPVPLPLTLLRAGSRVLGRGIGMVSRLCEDLCVNNASVKAALAIESRPFHPVPADWDAVSRHVEG